VRPRHTAGSSFSSQNGGNLERLRSYELTISWWFLVLNRSLLITDYLAFADEETEAPVVKPPAQNYTIIIRQDWNSLLLMVR
jgi:hypothetical protein